jgi:hypothetical protein
MRWPTTTSPETGYQAPDGGWMHGCDHPVEFRIPGLGFEGDLEPQGSRFDAVWGVEAHRVGHFAIEDGRTRTKLGVFVVKPD